MTPVLLALLAVVDSAFCGYRAAAGRSAVLALNKCDIGPRANLEAMPSAMAAISVSSAPCHRPWP